MKKIVLILVACHFLLSYTPTGYAISEIIETGEEVEVIEYARKMFIYKALQPWLGFNASDLYFVLI